MIFVWLPGRNVSGLILLVLNIIGILPGNSALAAPPLLDLILLIPFSSTHLPSFYEQVNATSA